QDLALTGSKRACDDSSCGACTVQVDGVPMLSCTMLAASCEGQEITTVGCIAEGLWRFRWRAMWFLYARVHDDSEMAAGQQPRPNRGRHSRGAEQQPLPLYRIFANVPGDTCGDRRRAKGRI